MTTSSTAFRLPPDDAGLDDELTRLEARIKAAPGDLALRTYLFQLLCVLGHWSRAARQLSVCATIDKKARPLAETYLAAIDAEKQRSEVFAGRQAPTFLETPPEWMNTMLSALKADAGGDAGGDAGSAEELRAGALEAADEQPGSIDGKPVAWMADADSRLGPVCEFIMNDRYGWIPYSRLQRLHLAPPRDLRDLVWATALATLADGRELALLIPARYPETELLDDELRLAKKTIWREPATGCWKGYGQRILVSDAAEHPLLDIRRLEFGAP